MFEFSNLPEPVIRHLNGLWRRRWTVLAVIWAAAIAGWIAVWLLPDKYESRAHVYVQTETILEPVLNGVTARPDYAERVDVMQQQLLTRPNLEEVVRRSGLDKIIKARSPMERRAKIEGLVNWLAGEIRIDSPRPMYFIISYKNSDPEMARAVVDAVLNMLIEQDLGATLSESDAAQRRLNLQIEQYEEKLTANERAVAEFRRVHAAELAETTGTTRRREMKENELERASDELERTKGRILTLQNLLSATSRTTSGDELETLRVKLAELRSKYREDHPDIRGVLARIDQLEKGGASSSNPEYVRLQSELRVAQDAVPVIEAREKRLREELETLDLAADQTPAAEADLQQIIREYEQTRKTYEDLLARRDRLALTRNLGAAGRGVEYQVFERPQSALLPSDPPRLLLILGVFVLAVGAGCGASFVLTALDKSYTQVDELQEAFGLPILGAVSESPSKAVLDFRRRDRRRLAAACAGIFALGGIYVYATVFRLPALLGENSVSASAGDHGRIVS